MNKIQIYSPAKINLNLKVIKFDNNSRKHKLKSRVSILKLCDVIQIIKSKSLNIKYHKLNKTIYTIASYHPAFLLRSPQYKKASWEDLQMLQKKLNDDKAS